MGIQERIAEEAKEVFKERYGKRSPDTVPTKEMDEVHHEAGIRVQRKIRKEREK